jgi:hypothetical protein
MIWNGHNGCGYIGTDIAITNISIFIIGHICSTISFFILYILYYILPNLTIQSGCSTPQSGCPNHPLVLPSPPLGPAQTTPQFYINFYAFTIILYARYHYVHFGTPAPAFWFFAYRVFQGLVTGRPFYSNKTDRSRLPLSALFTGSHLNHSKLLDPRRAFN